MPFDHDRMLGVHRRAVQLLTIVIQNPDTLLL